MDDMVRKAIEQIVDSNMRSFATGLKGRHLSEIDNPNGVINSKRKNVFIKELGSEFSFYSALVRSFDSSLGGVLETIGNSIAKISFDTTNRLYSFLLPAQSQKIQELIDIYSTDAKHRVAPEISHYNTFTCVTPVDITSYRREHITDHCFFDKEKNKYYILELKAGGDLDNKKAVAEKKELLTEYFMLRNTVDASADIEIYFATAYNKDGEGNYWKQGSVRNCFSEDELLIGKDYWDFVCNDKDGFNIVIEQYRKSAIHIQKALEEVKLAYLDV